MDEINIKLSEISKTAEQIRNYNSTLDGILAYVSKNMNELNSIWLSDGQEVLYSRFQSFANRFIDESEVIELYAKYLEDMVNSVSNVD